MTYVALTDATTSSLQQLSVPSGAVAAAKPGAAKGGPDYSIGQALGSLKFWQIW